MKKFVSLILSLIMILICTFPAYASDGVLNINKNDIGANVSSTLYGISLEDYYGCVDGGLNANMVNNNSFEYTKNPMLAWSCSEKFVVANQLAMNNNNPTYLNIDVKGKGTLKNSGYTEALGDNEDGAMAFKEGVNYIFTCYFQNIDFEGSISACLDSKTNSKESINISTSDIVKNTWRKVSVKIKASATENGGLSINFNGKGKICIDYVTLVPENSYGYGENAWRYTSLNPSLFSAIKSLNPSFVRFASGCQSESDGEGNYYSWKNTVGPVEKRKQCISVYDDFDNGLYLNNSNMVGYQEYFQLCADIGATPVAVVNAGIKCQNREKYQDYINALNKTYMDDNQWKAYMKVELGKKGKEASEYTEYINSLGIKTSKDFDKYVSSIALTPKTAEFTNYVQEVLDLIEFANGDSSATYWGGVRGQNGHQLPYNLKYIQVGSENWGEVYWRNFDAIKKEINKKYPNIKVIASTGTSESGEAFDVASNTISSSYSDVIANEHYVASKESRFDLSTSRYDSYDRSNAGVFVDYRCASFDFGKGVSRNNLYSATQEAAFMTGLERNSDIVKMSSIEATLVKNNTVDNLQGLIWFDANDVVLTPDYYAQMLFANNLGTKNVNSRLSCDDEKVFHSVTADDNGTALYIKLVNTGASKENITVKLDGFDNIATVSVQDIAGSYKSAPNTFKKQAIAPQQESSKYNDTDFSVSLSPYSATVVRVGLGKNNGQGFFSIPKELNLEVKSYMPISMKMLIVIMIAVFILGSVIGYFAYSKIVLKGKKFNWSKQPKNKDDENKE